MYIHGTPAESIESRSGAMQRLVEENFDKFIGIKAATATVYDELKQGPLSEEGDYSVADLRESLQCQSSRPSSLLAHNPLADICRAPSNDSGAEQGRRRVESHARSPTQGGPSQEHPRRV